MEENLMPETEEELVAEELSEKMLPTEEAEFVDDESQISEPVSDNVIGQTDIENKTETLDDLRAEVERLRSALENKEKENERMLEEIGEFSELFPKKSLDSIPEEVWDKVKSGVPLAAAYALYEKKAEARAAFTEEVNRKNAERSSGAVGREVGSIYYSPSEVRKMSAAEVKKNYAIIIESMKKWN